MSTLPQDSRGSLALLHSRLTARLAQDGIELPLFPETASRVLLTCESPDCDAQHLAKVLESDPALASNVLRVANSAAYAPVEPIQSLTQGVSRLGFSAVCSIATALALKGDVFVVPGFEKHLTAMWKHSTLTAAWCKELARQRRRNVEGAFLAGLLHNVGQPVMLQFLSHISSEAGVDLDDALLGELLDDGYDELGERLLNEWKLPNWTAHAARYHRDPKEATSCLEEVHTTSLGNALSRWSMDGSEANEAAIRSHESLGKLGIYPDELSGLLDKAENVEVAAEAFQ